MRREMTQPISYTGMHETNKKGLAAELLDEVTPTSLWTHGVRGLASSYAERKRALHGEQKARHGYHSLPFSIVSRQSQTRPPLFHHPQIRPSYHPHTDWSRLTPPRRGLTEFPNQIPRLGVSLENNQKKKIMRKERERERKQSPGKKRCPRRDARGLDTTARARRGTKVSPTHQAAHLHQRGRKAGHAINMSRLRNNTLHGASDETSTLGTP